MFRKLRTVRCLRIAATAELAVVGFTPAAERVARVHQFGLRDRVRQGGPEVRYAARGLLGLTEAEIEAVKDEVLRWVT